MEEVLLRTNNLTKVFGKQKAVNQVNVTINKGSIYGFIGRNGAGKTTFLRMISGLAAQTEGEISLFGKTGKDLSSVRKRIGCLIEAPGIYGNLTAYENIKAKCIFCGVTKRGYIEEILDIVGLSDAGKKKAKNFSLGMKQRLGIGLAMVGEPDLLVLDEPINGLDPKGIVEVRETILKLNKERNMTILISSHILEELSKIATHYGILHQGVLLEELTREELMEQCSQRIVVNCDKPQQAVTVLDKMGITKYQVTDQNHVSIFERLDESGSINRQLVQANILVNEIAVAGEELESYYLRVTGGMDHV